MGTTTDQLSEAFMLLAEKCGEKYGTPLPKKLLSIGNPDKGWGVVLNAATDAIDGHEGIIAKVTWNGWPAAILSPFGGSFVVGEAANEDSFIEWLKSYSPPSCERT